MILFRAREFFLRLFFLLLLIKITLFFITKGFTVILLENLLEKFNDQR